MTTKVEKLRCDEGHFRIGFYGIEIMLLCFCSLHGFAIYKMIPIMVAKNGGVLLIFSWIMYGIVTLQTAGCLAELTALVPCTGSTYHYCYLTISEFLAFLVGWHKILAYSAIILSYCSFVSSVIDETFLGGWLRTNMLFGEPGCFNLICFKGYLDLFLPVIILFLAYLASWSIETCKVFTMVVTSISLIVIFIISCGLIIYDDIQPPRIFNKPQRTLFQGIGETVFFGLMSYDSIAVLGKEAEHPSRTIPNSIVNAVVMAVIWYVLFTLLLFTVKSEDTILIEDTYLCPLSIFLKNQGYGILSWLSDFGAIVSLWGGAFAMIFSFSRIIYSMSRDRLLFPFCSKVLSKSHAPVLPTMLFGTILSFIGIFIAIDHNAAAFSVVVEKVIISVSLLVTRYRCEKEEERNEETHKRWILFNYPNGKTAPTKETERVSRLLIFLIVLTARSSVYSILMMFAKDAEFYMRILALCSALFFVIFVVCLCCQPQNNRVKLSFTVPSVPTIPVLSILFEFFIETYFARTDWRLDYCWALMGIIFYFTYSIVHSEKKDLTDALGNKRSPLLRKRRNENLSIKRISMRILYPIIKKQNVKT